MILTQSHQDMCLKKILLSKSSAQMAENVKLLKLNQDSTIHVVNIKSNPISY